MQRRQGSWWRRSDVIFICICFLFNKKIRFPIFHKSSIFWNRTYLPENWLHRTHILHLYICPFSLSPTYLFSSSFSLKTKWKHGGDTTLQPPWGQGMTNVWATSYELKTGVYLTIFYLLSSKMDLYRWEKKRSVMSKTSLQLTCHVNTKKNMQG